VYTYGLTRAELARGAVIDPATLRAFMEREDFPCEAQILNRLWATASYHLDAYQKETNEQPVPTNKREQIAYLRRLEAGLSPALAMQRWKDRRAGGARFQQVISDRVLKKAFLSEQRGLINQSRLYFPDNLRILGWKALLQDYEKQPEKSTLTRLNRSIPKG